MNVKSSLNWSVLDDFRTSDGWLNKWKLNHGIREKEISGESWKQLSRGWRESENYVLGIIIKTFGPWARVVVSLKHSSKAVVSSKGIAKKGKKIKSGKKWKQRVTVTFFVSANGGKVRKLFVIWKSENTRCFRKPNVAAKRDKSLIFQTQNNGSK